MKEGRIPVDVALEHFRAHVEASAVSWMNRPHCHQGRRPGPGRPHRAEPEVEGATLDGVLGFITAVYGVSLTPSDPSS
jgi:hypothetical protein